LVRCNADVGWVILNRCDDQFSVGEFSVVSYYRWVAYFEVGQSLTRRYGRRVFGWCDCGVCGRWILELGEDEADAAYDVVGWGFVGGEGEKLDGEVSGVGAEDETGFVEVDKAEEEGCSAADCVEGGLMGSVGGQRVVVAVEDGDGSGGDERVHGGGLLGVGADGEEALPVGVPGGGAGAVVVKARGGDLDGFDDGSGRDAGLVHGGGGGDDGDDLDGVAGLGGGGGL
jgi:hypothetical protein